MPVCLIEAPTVIRRDAKKPLIERTAAALNEAYPIPDVRIFLREYPIENAGRQDGRIQSEPTRPVVFIEAPQLPTLDTKRKMVKQVNVGVSLEGEKPLNMSRNKINKKENGRANY